MNRTIIRYGNEGVDLRTTKDQVAIRHGRDGINGTIYLDWGEARELAEAILTDSAEMVGPQGRHVA